jgi:hypothetical protein
MAVLSARPGTARVALLAVPHALGTVPAMSDQSAAPQPLPRLRSLTQRAEPSIGATRSPARTISRVRPEVVVGAAVGAAALVDLHSDLHSDLRLSLATLVRDAGVELGDDQHVLSLATGFVEVPAR